MIKTLKPFKEIYLIKNLIEKYEVIKAETKATKRGP